MSQKCKFNNPDVSFVALPLSVVFTTAARRRPTDRPVSRGHLLPGRQSLPHAGMEDGHVQGRREIFHEIFFL